MKASTVIKTFGLFLRDRLPAMILFLLFLLVFAVLTTLYSLPLSGVVYACMLCLSILLITGILDFSRYLRKHVQLVKLAKSPLHDIYNLPLPSDQMEHDYVHLLEELLKTHQTAELQAENTQRMQLEYYSLWTHQIKVPISAMDLLLQEGRHPSDAKLKPELFKIEQYVDMALNYVRLSGDETDYLIKTYPLDSIIRQAVRKFAPLFIQKKLAVDYQDTAISVLTDEKWLVFALEQVLSNAIKYSRQGRITIWVDEASQTLYIKDQGIGIASDDLPRIYEHGYTGYNGRDDKRATGLGLYLCKRVLTKLGHTIEITSDLGAGTQVAINLSKAHLIFD